MGTSIFGHREFILQQDHPHAYGDKILFLQQRKSPIGSSPRVWGQVHICRYLCKSLGIIPTRMGTSFVNFIIKLRQQDHPHAYGDKELNLKWDFGLIGSSPRVWGQVITWTCSNNFQRIIPTRMGTSRNRLKHDKQTWDHPHAYGDKFLTKNGYLPDEGSSPRVWGQESLTSF